MRKLDHCNIVRLRYFFYSSGEKVSPGPGRRGVSLCLCLAGLDQQVPLFRARIAESVDRIQRRFWVNPHELKRCYRAGGF
ncbi:hypothetical protein FKM82_019420 [Ascaphus truei]